MNLFFSLIVPEQAVKTESPNEKRSSISKAR
jgi:hypothetical protein